ncbi:MAG TPA: restriction endonuclease subunit S [Candidatus Saccharimonadales bacterium]
MTVNDLRTLIDNLDEYIHIPGGIERLKKTVLQLAVSGQLVSQDPSEGTGENLYQQIQAEKQKLATGQKIKKQKPLLDITEDEIPFSIPTSWKWVRLGSISSDISYGYTESANKINIGPKFVRITDIQGGSVDWDRVPYCKINESDKQKYLLSTGDLLFARTGGTVGKSYLCIDPPESVFASYLIRVRTLAENSEYLVHFFDTQVYWDQIYSELSGTGQPNFNGTKLSNLILPLPPLAEQKRIVEKVNAIFGLISTLSDKYAAEQVERKKLVISSLASLSRGDSDLALSNISEIMRTKSDAIELRKSIRRLAVSGRLVSQKPSEGTGEELYEQIKLKLFESKGLKKQKIFPEITTDEIQIQIPKTWKWVRLGDVSIYQQRGKSPKYTEKSNFPVISQKCVRTDHIDWSAIKYITSDSADKYENFRFLQKGDLLLNSTGTGTMGRVGIFSESPDYDKVVVDSHVTVVRFSEEVSAEFAHLCFNAPFIQNDIESKASGSTNQIEWNLSAIQNELLPLPPLSEQYRIVAKTNQLLDLVSKFELALETSKQAVLAAEAAKQVQQATVQQGVVVVGGNQPELSKQQKKVQRKMLACFVANESLDGSQFGKTKFEKLLHLVEYHVLKRDLNQRYSVQPAGPYDGGFTRLFWNDVIRSKWFRVEGYGNLQKIVAGDNHEKSQKDYGYLSDDEKGKIRDLIKMFSKWGYGEAEIISTLYAAWNNRLIKGEEVSDDLLKQDFLQWDPQKTQYSDRLDRALAWMRQNNIIPDGWGNEIKRAKSDTRTVR